MKIKNFKFSNNEQNWHIEQVDFNALNLLVGASGVGKTRILRALDLICDVAKDRNRILNNLEWNISFSHLGKDYKWELKTSPADSIEDILDESEQSAEIIHERLIRYDDKSEVEIFYRTPSDSRLNNDKLPKLKRTESAITLLAEEDTIVPVRQAFKRFIFNEIPQTIMIRAEFNLQNAKLKTNSIEQELQKFKEEIGDSATILKGFFLQNFFPDTFDEVKEYYTEIFPSVKDIRIGIDEDHRLFFEIKENDVEGWIPKNNISSGMMRTLTCLIEIIVAPEESAIAIDEFENSLGINCMPELTDFILERSPEVQFILTSHHPYIINNIPWETWQIVSRKGSRIKVTKATDIPQLDTASSLDKFTQLVNVLECEDIST